MSRDIRLVVLGILTGINAFMLLEAKKQRNQENIDLRDIFDTQEYSNRFNH